MVKYIFSDLNSPTGKVVTGTQLIKIARDYLAINKKLHGLDKELKASDIKDVRDAQFYLENIGFKVEKTEIPKNKQWIVIDQYNKPYSNIAGITKTQAIEIKKNLEKRQDLFKGKVFKINKYKG